MNEQEQFWKGDFGNAYTKRNNVDWWARVPFWASVIGRTRPRSVLEFGCNAGWNLMAIRSLGFHMRHQGVDINEQAVALADQAHLDVEVRSDLGERRGDLVFTAGVLIHVAPENLASTMRMIAAASNRWVVAVEYDNPFVEEVEYRGARERLWKRPFGKLYAEAVPGLKIVDKEESVGGFDRCTAWLFEKALVSQRFDPEETQPQGLNP